MKFISITKPGMIFGNLVTVSGGFFLGSTYPLNPWLYFAVLLGMTFIIASGCVANNHIDRDIDKLMERTKDRVSAQDLISPQAALIYSALLALAGILVLAFGTNLLTVIVALVGLFFYVFAYTLWSKRQSLYGTAIGGIAGAVPPVAGYCAITNHFDSGAIILFFILFFWQLPHFYSICFYRLQDFAAASLPIMPLKKGAHYTKVSMVIYIIAFTISAVLPSVFSTTGVVYFIVALLLGLIWLVLSLQGFKSNQANSDRVWARKMFLFSILNVTVLSFMMLVK